MQIHTKFHGTLNIEQEKTWAFPKGMPGFEDEKEFIILPIEDNEQFHVLQSTTTAAVAFIIVDPYTIVESYTLKVDDPTLDLLKIKNETDVFVLAVLSAKNPFDTSTINLQAPLIFNTKTRKAKQMILNDNTFSMHHPISMQETTEGKA